jgi:hypothetical protein
MGQTTGVGMGVTSLGSLLLTLAEEDNRQPRFTATSQLICNSISQ